jgi:GTP1/Obg family GTP-binding protein
MGIFTKKKKSPQQKSYPALIDLAIYIKNLKECLSDPKFIKSFTDENIDAYLKELIQNKEENKKMSRRITGRQNDTINTLKNSLVELAINIQAFQKELSQLPEGDDE